MRPKVAGMLIVLALVVGLAGASYLFLNFPRFFGTLAPRPPLSDRGVAQFVTTYLDRLAAGDATGAAGMYDGKLDIATARSAAFGAAARNLDAASFRVSAVDVPSRAGGPGSASWTTTATVVLRTKDGSRSVDVVVAGRWLIASARRQVDNR